MSRLYSLFIVLLMFGIPAWAQGPDTLWTRALGGAADDWGYDVIQATDGNYVIAGATKSYGDNPATGNAFILKVNDSGDTLWTKVYGGTGGEDVDAIQQTSDGGYILAGYTSSGGANGADFYLLKLNSSGDFEWSRYYGGANAEEARSVHQTSDGGYILVGYTRSYGLGVPGFENLFVVRTNASGDTLWTRTYGGTGGETGFGVEQASDGNYVVAGYSGSYGIGGNNAWLLKLNSSGDTLWTRTYGGPGADIANWLAKTNDGGYVLVGSSSSYTAGINQFYLVKVDSTGTQQWFRHYGGLDHEYAYSVQQTFDGGYVLAGITKSYGPGVPAANNEYVVKTDTVGDTLWTRVYGGTNNEVANAVRQVNDGGYIVAGYTRSYGTGVPNANVYLVRLETETPLVTPEHLVTQIRNDSLIFSWDDNANPFHRIYSAASVGGPFTTLAGSTNDNLFVILNPADPRRFYRLVGSVGP